MSLRFQREDEVDREVRKNRRLLWIVVPVAFFGAIFGLTDWLFGESSRQIREEFGGLLALAFLYWLLSPIYREFCSRTKEIDGKVSAIEEAVIASKEDQTELMEKLAAIEDKLVELAERVEDRDHPGASATSSSGGIREGLRIVDESVNRSDSPR